MNFQLFWILQALTILNGQGFVRIGNNGNTNSIQINNIGSDTFNPNKLNNLVHDIRFPLIIPNNGTYKNIYAPSAVNNGINTWNIYFGGWDGSSMEHDEIYITVTDDTFDSFNQHYLMLSNGEFVHINNCNAIKVNDSFWVMMYTGLYDNINKPGYTIATNGINWNPNSGNVSYFINMNGYPYNWTNANVNGGNIIYYDNITGIYHLYFIDFNELNEYSVFHAISYDIMNWNYIGIALNESNRICNDIKYINGYYIMGFHNNGQNVYYSISNNYNIFPKTQILFNHFNDNDQYIVSMGFVVNNNNDRLLGILYGAGNVSTLNMNRIFGIWLQKRVLFINDNSTFGIDDATRSIGPNNASILLNQDNAVGKFYLYDSDYKDITNRGTFKLEMSGNM